MKDLDTTGPQGPAATVSSYLQDAVAAIDAAFGEGHAKAHPELVAHFLQACAIESAVASGHVATDRAIGAAREISRDTNETILKLKPRLFG